MAKCILAVTLSECPVLLHGHADDEAHCVRSEYRGICVVLRPFPVLVIAKNHDAGLGMMEVHHLVGLYGEDAHGWNHTRSALLLRQFDCFIRVHRDDTVFLLPKAL